MPRSDTARKSDDPWGFQQGWALAYPTKDGAGIPFSIHTRLFGAEIHRCEGEIIVEIEWRVKPQPPNRRRKTRRVRERV